MKNVIQIFTGGWHNQLYDIPSICQRIKLFTEYMPVDTVIMGWNLNTKIYQEVGEYLHKNNITFYLWMPVFSEIMELGEYDPAIDIFGEEPGGYNLQEGENFEFLCPSSEKNHQLLLDIYDRYFKECPFDGIFLDKIRTQSFVSGAEGVLGCCCPSCTQKFKDFGYDLNQFRFKIQENGIKKMFLPSSFDPVSGFHFSEPLTEKFFDAKCSIFTEEIGSLVCAFRDNGLKIGMDVFAPALSRLVGQDISSLLNEADFIKPMMYRMTEAPAGIGFEYRAMKSAVGNEADFDRLIGGGRALETSEELFRSQICIDGKEKLFPGIEFNYKQDIARTTLDYVKSSIQTVIESRCGGIVYSWDAMLTPVEFLSVCKEESLQEVV